MGDRREAMAELRRRADDLCRMILTDDYPQVDIDIARERLREYAEAAFPDRTGLYEMVYESRFDRLMGQFRGEPQSWQRGHDAEDDDQ